MGADSDRPTWSKSLRSKETLLTSIKNIATALIGIVGVVVTTVSTVTLYLDRFATDVELRQSSDATLEVARALEGRIKTLEESRLVQDRLIEEEHRASVELGRRFVSVIAADREQIRELKSAAAEFYRDEYDLLLGQGRTVEDAIREALKSRWINRPKLR